MQTITTRYKGPTDCNGSRIVASATNGQRLTHSIDNSQSTDDNHTSAAQTLARRLNWRGKLQGGHTASGMVWAFIDTDNQIEV